MFSVTGSIGMFSIGLVGGFYFARFFDAKGTSLSAAELVSLLTILGIGGSAVALIRAYFDLNLVDPYGFGVAMGAATNLTIQFVSKILLAARAKPGHAPQPAQVPQPPEATRGKRTPVLRPMVIEIAPKDFWGRVGGAALSLTSSSTSPIYSGRAEQTHVDPTEEEF